MNKNTECTASEGAAIAEQIRRDHQINDRVTELALRVESEARLGNWISVRNMENELRRGGHDELANRAQYLLSQAR